MAITPSPQKPDEESLENVDETTTLDRLLESPDIQ
jgi:hypothetical protein